MTLSFARLGQLIASAAAVLATVTTLAAPASASVSQGYVAGTGTITNDWGDEGTMSQNSHRISGATGMWQWVLYADGATESNGTAFDEADIDCDFGPNTAAATRDWQGDHGLTADGIVGANTLSTADNKLRLVNGDLVRYVGRAHTINLGLRLGSESENPGEYYIDVPGCVCEGAVFEAVYGDPTPGHSGCW